MDALTLVAHSLRVVLTGLRAARVGPPASMSSSDVVGNAHGLSYAVLATSWQRRNTIPSWASIYEQWESQLPEAPSIDASLYGYFDPADRFELLTDNAAAFEKRDQLYQSATRSVDVSTYYIQADEVGWRTSRALADCARRGVRVRVISDRCFTARKIFENPKVLDVIRFLRDAGVEYRLYCDPARPYDACHRKLLIVDGVALMTGGRNYANHYAGVEWRDIDLLLTGPSVARVQPFYEGTFAGLAMPGNGSANGNIFQPAAPGSIVSNSPFIFLLQCIRACRKTLDIENAYYFNHPVIRRHLADACRRGVRVRLFTNSAESNDLPHMTYRLYCGFPELLDAGVSLYLRRGNGRTLHCKYFVADGEWVGYGSSNLDYFSPRFCLELGIQVRDRGLGQALTSWFEQGIEEADLMTDRAEADSVASRQTIGRVFDRWCQDIQ